jgi:hypothetical protein
MATTTNYGFEIPDDTDLVKDGALAMRDLGQDVDTTLATALNANDYAGMVLVKTQTIGSAVSSVTVTNAFSATYDNYKIIVSGGVGSLSNEVLRLQLGSITTGYYGGLIYTGYTGSTVSGLSQNNAANLSYVGTVNTFSLNAQIEVNAPFLTEQKMISATFYDGNNHGRTQGLCDGLTSVSAFTLIVSTGTITGGTIAVYGYGKS